MDHRQKVNEMQHQIDKPTLSSEEKKKLKESLQERKQILDTTLQEIRKEIQDMKPIPTAS